jgi:uncharacterized protein (UPF0276 family)
VKTPLRLTGIGLRTPHHAELLEKRPGVAWVEVHSENFFSEGGKRIQTLDEVSRLYPVSLHGVGLSLGSHDELNWHHLKKLRELINRINPCLVSEHLSWSSIHGRYLNDLLPLPYTQEAVDHLVLRIQQVQDYLKRQILIENISAYIRYPESEMPEHAFLRQIALKSGCGILLDINNLYVNSRNLGVDTTTYLKNIPSESIHEFHLAGFTSTTIDMNEVLIDSHNRPVMPAVWDLYREAIAILGRKPTIIEWDTDLPSLDTLCLEASKAETILRESYVAAKCAS